MCKTIATSEVESDTLSVIIDVLSMKLFFLLNNNFTFGESDNFNDN